MRLEIRPRERAIAEDGTPLYRSVIPVAECDDGVLVAIDDRAAGAPAIELPQGAEWQVLPELRPAVAQHIHIVGPSGCGKSTWAGRFANRFAEEKGGRVVVVSADAEDDEALPCDLRIPLSEELGGVRLEDLTDDENPAPLLLVFDDVEGVAPELDKALRIFRRAALERGRKQGISTLNVYHRGAAGKSTADSLNEATGFVVFPQGGITANTAYMLHRHAGIHRDLMGLIRRVPEWGRSVYISSTFPPMLVGERRAAILDPYDVEKAAVAQKRGIRAGPPPVAAAIRGARGRREV